MSEQPTVLHVFVVRCNDCRREAHIKAEGPPYFPYWTFFADHGDNIDKWQLPVTSKEQPLCASPEILCGDCRAMRGNHGR